MERNEWSEPIEIDVPRLGKCKLYYRYYNREYHQYKIKYGFTEAIGDYNISKEEALNNAFIELKRPFKTIFSNN